MIYKCWWLFRTWKGKFPSCFIRVTVAWRHQSMTSYISMRTVPFKHHCKIRKWLLSILYKFHIILSYIHRDMRVFSELFYPPTYMVITQWWEGGLILFDKIPVSTLEMISNVPFTYPCPRNLLKSRTALIRGASSCVSNELWNKNAIGGRRWDVAAQEQGVCNMEIKIVTLVVKGNVKLTVPADWQE